MFWFGFAITQAIGIFDGGTVPWTVNATCLGLALIFMVMTGFLYRVRVEQRKEWREQRYREWLDREIPGLAEQTDWSEIERAMGALLGEGIEPTYERAEAWLKRDSFTEAKRTRDGAIKAHLVPPRIMYVKERMIMRDKRQNPFKPPGRP